MDNGGEKIRGKNTTRKWSPEISIKFADTNTHTHTHIVGVERAGDFRQAMEAGVKGSRESRVDDFQATEAGASAANESRGNEVTLTKTHSEKRERETGRGSNTMRLVSEWLREMEKEWRERETSYSSSRHYSARALSSRH